MKKSTLAIVLMLGAALSASAITTTLEYEDQREAASRAAISNEITTAVGAVPVAGNYAAVSNAAMSANAYTDAKIDEVAAHSATTKVVRLYSGGGSRFISGDGSVYSQRAEERWHVEFMGETYDLEPNFGLSPNYWEGQIDGRMGYLAYEWEYAGCWSLNIGMGNDFITEGVASDSSVTFTIGTFEIRCTRYSEGIGFNYETRLAYTNDLDFSQSNTTLVKTIKATAPAPGNYETVSNRAMNAITVAPEVFATNLIKTVMSNSLYNLTYDQTLGVTWRKTAEGGAFYERCYTNVNMIGVLP